jgi:hypothetical protein
MVMFVALFIDLFVTWLHSVVRWCQVNHELWRVAGEHTPVMWQALVNN